jgi:hypothetical protein
LNYEQLWLAVKTNRITKDDPMYNEELHTQDVAKILYDKWGGV